MLVRIVQSEDRKNVTWHKDQKPTSDVTFHASKGYFKSKL